MTAPLRVALVGPGRIAIAHLEAMKANADVAELVAIAGVEHERERTGELVRRYGAERAVHDFAEVLDAGDIQAVVLTVPNHLHAELAIRLLERGIHVLVEKPLANSLAESDAMIEAAARSGATLMVGQCRRWFDGARAAKARIASLGRPLSFVHVLGVWVEHAQTAWWKHSSGPGGLAVELNGPHVIDSMLWLVDAEPVRVFAQTRRLRDEWAGEDEAVLVVDFADGSVATGCISLNTRPAVNDRWIAGPHGGLRLTDDRTLWVDGRLEVEQEVTPYIGGDVSFERQFREFADALREGREPETSGAALRPVAAVMEAVDLSRRTNAPVALAELASGTPSA
jgi:UDP-N-acetyl-2-amino-2-deoxyglucuronate dehydrogenase